MPQPLIPLLVTVLMTGSASAQVILPVEPPVRFAIYDARSRSGPGVPQLTLTLQSERDYATLQYRYDATTTITGDSITVDITRVINDSDLQQYALGPAWYSTPLKLTPGIYQLRLRADSFVDHYRVRIGTDVIDVVGDSGELTIPPPRVYRLPPRAVYLHCIPAGFSTALCEDFLKLVSVRIGVRGDLALGAIDHDPFRYPLPDRRGPDPYPQMLLTDVSEEQFTEALTMARAFTDLYRYAQYRVSLVIWRANGPGFSCFDGVCRQQ